jgi:fumarate hydratase class II
MNAISNLKEQSIRKETDSLGAVNVPADKLWGAQTQRRWNTSASVRI